MIKIDKVVLNIASHLIMDSQLWSDVKVWVKDLEDNTSLTPSQKHDKVKADLKMIFKDLSDTLLDIAIKMAVLYVRIPV